MFKVKEENQRERPNRSNQAEKEHVIRQKIQENWRDVDNLTNIMEY